MYLMYVDESGDTGTNAGASDFFVLSGLIVHEGYWTSALTDMASKRDELSRHYGMRPGAEFHATKMIGRTKKSEHNLSRTSAVLLFRDLLRFESTLTYLRVINVVVDKRNSEPGADIFKEAWNRLISAFEIAIREGLIPTAWDNRPTLERGFLIVDQTNEEKLRKLVREMRHGFERLSPPTYTVDRDHLLAIVEDPMHKKSELSLPIQLSDANAYFLLQLQAPNSTVKRHKAHNYFYYLEPILCKEVCPSDSLGVIRA